MFAGSRSKSSPGTATTASAGSSPRLNVRQACGSRSTASTFRPRSDMAEARAATVVVLATPPFWLATATVRVTVPAVVPPAATGGNRTAQADARGAAPAVVSTGSPFGVGEVEGPQRRVRPVQHRGQPGRVLGTGVVGRGEHERVQRLAGPERDPMCRQEVDDRELPAEQRGPVGVG